MKILRILGIAIIAFAMLFGAWCAGVSWGYDIGYKTGNDRASNLFYTACERGTKFVIDENTAFYCGKVNDL